MKSNPSNWEKHYSGNIDYKLQYSLLDRSRYYYDQPIVNNAVETLISNLETINIPHSLLSQFLPTQHKAVRLNIIENSPKSLICDKIQEVLKSYQRATNQD